MILKNDIPKTRSYRSREQVGGIQDVNVTAMNLCKCKEGLRFLQTLAV